MPNVLTQFSNVEDSYYQRFRQKRDLFFVPVCKILTALRFKAEYLSFLSLLLIIPFVLFFQTFPFLSFFSLLFSVVLDGLDGCLARYQHTESEKGALLDIAIDHTVFFCFILTLIFTKTIDGFWGSVYSLNYLLMVFFTIVLRAFKIHVFPLIRSKYYFYFLWAFFLFTGWNYFGIFLVFFSIYMVLTNIFLFEKLRCSLS